MPTTFNLPTEGTVFRGVGDTNAVYKIVNGQLTSLGGGGKIASTDLRAPDGTIIRAGQPITGDRSYTDQLTPVDTNFRGTYWSNTTDANAYGSGFNALPEFNIADITTAQQQGHDFKTGSFSVNTDPAIQGYNNPNPVNSTTGGYAAQSAPTTQNAQYNPNATIQTPGTMGGATGQTPQTQQGVQVDQQFQTWLNSQNLSADQKAALTAVYGAIGTNDQATGDKLKAAITAGTQYSNPYFAAQSKLLVDALDRGLQAKDGDLAYNENSLNNRLADVRKTITDSRGYLTFQQQQEMKDLERKFDSDLNATQEDMASRGFNSSSIRARKEQLIGDTYGDMRESSNRAFQIKDTGLTDQLNSAQRDTTAEVARLRQLAEAGKLDLLRTGEQKLGSDAIGKLNYNYQPLGGVGGELPRQQQLDANSFANSFVF